MKVFLNILYGNIKEPDNWLKIFGEYQDLNRDEKQSIVISLMKEIQFLTNKIFLIKVLLVSISKKFNPSIAENLKTLLPKFRWNAESFTKDCKQSIGQIKAMQVSLNNKTAQLKQINDKSSKEISKITDWDAQFIALSKYQGYRIDPNIITVSEYCNILNSFKKYVKSLEKHKK